MAVDGLIIHQQLKTIQKLLPARISKISQPSTLEILLTLRHNSQNYQLLLCSHSQYNRLNLTKLSYQNPATPSAFVMLLRKHLENGSLEAIEQDGLDRCVKFTIKKHNEIGELQSSYLYLELMGKYANLILADQHNIILDALKRIPPFENSKRIIFSGAEYIANTRPPRHDPLSHFEASLETSLMEQFEGFSPLLAKEVSYRLANNEKFSKIMQELEASSTIYYYPLSRSFHVLPLKHLKESAIEYGINEGFDLIYGSFQEVQRVEQLSGNLFRFVKSELKKNLNKLPKLQQSYQEACDCEQFRLIGDLIFANLSALKKGMTAVSLYDYESQKNIEIPLDPRLDPKANGTKYYHRYRKSKNGQTHLRQQIELCNQEISYFTALQQQLAIADLTSANEIKRELIRQAYLKTNPKQYKKSTGSPPNYRELSCEGAAVFVGLNNLQNNYLTFKLANKEDTWFHAKDYHGAHVIIKEPLPDETQIRFCANLAAYYSQGRQSSSVPVDYCQVKNIKKIPNSKAGLVSITNYKTIYIDPVTPD